MKSVYALFLALSVVVLSAPAMSDQWTSNVTLESLSVSRVDLNQNVSIEGTCISNRLAYLSPSAENHDAMLSLLMAAVVSGKEVQLYCSDRCASGSRCVVKNVRLVR